MEDQSNSTPATGVNDQAQAPVQQNPPAKTGPISAYCMKTKEKNVPLQDATISRTGRGGYMAQGHDGKGNKMTTMLSQANAVAAVDGGHATWAEGSQPE